VQHFEGDVGVEEGVEEDVDFLLGSCEYDLADFSEFREGGGDILVVHLGFFQWRGAGVVGVGVGVDFEGESYDGEAVGVEETFISKFVL